MSQQASIETIFDLYGWKRHLDYQLSEPTILLHWMSTFWIAQKATLVTKLFIGNFAGMTQLQGQQHRLESIDQSLIQKVVLAYKSYKDNGLGEMAARNAAVMVLSENLPSWTFRAASDMVSRIIEFSMQSPQTA